MWPSVLRQKIRIGKSAVSQPGLDIAPGQVDDNVCLVQISRLSKLGTCLHFLSSCPLREPL